MNPLVVGGFVVAAALGAWVRAGVTVWTAGLGGLAARSVRVLPVGTLAVNLTGALALGLVHGWGGPAATVVGTAGVGALTTFSTLSAEVVALRDEHPGVAAGYLVVSLVGGVGLAALGLSIAR